MASVSLFLKTPKAHTSRIAVRLRDGRSVNLNVSSDYSINPKHWKDSTVQSGEPNCIKINNSIKGYLEEAKIDGQSVKLYREGFKDKVLDSYLTLKKEGETPTSTTIREKLSEPIKQTKSIPDDLIEYLELYLNDVELKTTTKELSKETLKSYKSLKNKIINFQKHSTTKYKVQDVDMTFYNTFKDYSIKVEKYSLNTFGNDINRLKTALTTAKEEYKIKVSEDVFSSRFKRLRVKTNFVTLNDAELLKIAKHDFSKSPYLDNARDWLIIGCYVGQRVSDLLNLTTKNITTRKGRRYIELTQQKTGKKITLPIHSLIENTLLKNKGRFPRKISSQNLNSYVKKVCQDVGLTQKVEGSKMNIKTKRKEYGEYEKWELIISHDFRRSFCSNHYGKIPTKVLKGLSGHSTEAMLLKYINREETDDADSLSEYWDSQPAVANPNLKIG